MVDVLSDLSDPECFSDKDSESKQPAAAENVTENAVTSDSVLTDEVTFLYRVGQKDLPIIYLYLVCLAFVLET